MSPSAWSFTAYWRRADLVRDFDVLVRCGRIAAAADRAGDATPAGWFRHAAAAYAAVDADGVLARRTCLLVAHRFASEVPS